MRRVLAGCLITATLTAAAPTFAENAPGVTDSEIKMGQTNFYSGPASAYGVVGNAELAYFQMINDQGGINGRKLLLVSLDDGANPGNTVEQTRRLVEQDKVAFIFGTPGTATNMAIRKYLNDRGVPQLFIGSGDDKFDDYQHFHWTLSINPSYRAEARIYAKYLLRKKPDAKIAILYQHDNFGKAYLDGLKDTFGGSYEQRVVTEASYQVSEPTADSQIVQLQASGADVLVNASTAKWAAQSIRKIGDIGWRPLHILTVVSTSIGAVLEPAGLDKSKGIITAFPYKDPTDTRWKNDVALREWNTFMDKYFPTADRADGYYLYGYSAAQAMAQTLRQCGNDLSRQNIMRQATNLNHVEVANLLPGITLDTSPTNYRPVTQMQMNRFDGEHWIGFGEVISAQGSWQQAR